MPSAAFDADFPPAMTTATLNPTNIPARPRPPEQRFGLSCALITPVEASGAIDEARLVIHARRVLEQGCRSVTLFGTTGEGASFGLPSRARAFEALARAGVAFERQVLGSAAASSIDECVAQANQAFDVGAAGLLLAPPFYFKGVSDEGLYAWHCRVLDTVRDPRGVILYHLPSVTQVPLSVSLIGRLARAYPGVVTGVKDSSGVWDNTAALLAAFPDLHILVGDERQLARAVRHGGSGAINGFSNFLAPRLRPLVEEGRDDPAVSTMVDRLLAVPVIPGVKALVAEVYQDPGYAIVAPPLETLAGSTRDGLIADFRRLLGSHQD